MKRFMLVTFAFLAWVFYEMSGGADFDPDRARAGVEKSDPLKSADASDRPTETVSGESTEVTRVALDLTSLEDVLTGTDGTERAEAGRTQRTGPDTRMASLPQVDTVEVSPSLEESAGAVSDTDRVLPSLIRDASPEADVAETAVALDSGGDIRVVTGSRVNVRNGPGTDFGVVASMVEGDRVEVLDDNGDGWVRMRPVGGGTAGWMADFLLSDG